MSVEGTSNFMKGMATGVCVGAAVSMLTGGKRKTKLQKKTESVLKNIEDVIDTAINVMK